MSSDKQNNSAKIALIAGGAVLAAGAAWYLFGRGQDEAPVVVKKKRDPAAAAEPTAAPANAATTASAAAAESNTAEPQAAAVEQQPGMGRQTTTMMVNEYSFDQGTNAATAADKRQKVYQPPVADKDGVIFFDSVGIRLQLARGWTSSEETSPMPNVAMLSFAKADFANRQMTGMPGEVPVIVLSIEDISNEGISVDEFREKSKQMALGQMSMMTGGAIAPRVLEDVKLDSPIGPFKYSLMYEIATPMFSMRVLNLVAVQDGLVYILQIMCSPREFTTVRNEVVGMAKTMAIESRPAPSDFRTVSCVTATAAAGTASVPPMWQLEKASATNPIFRFTTASQSRAESVEIYNASLDKAIDLSKPNVTSSKTIRDVTVSDMGNMRVAKKGDAVVVCTARHSGKIVTSHDALASICESVDFNRTSTEDKLAYHSEALHLGFAVAKGARIIESRVSERILVYGPAGFPSSPADELPMLTIRVGDPSNDPDCRTSFDEWMARIREETDGETISDLKRDTVAGRECVTFLNKEMQEVGPGQKEERTAKVIIYLTGDRTTMLRWETPSGVWRKHEGKLKAVLASLQIE